MVYFVPITEEAFAEYRKGSVREYADLQVSAGLWPANEAMKLSEREFGRLLPQGVATKNHFLYQIEAVETGEPVGVAWVAVLSKNGVREGYIYDIRIDEGARSKGYGTTAMKLLEEKIRDMGVNTIRLRVHAHNKKAHELYQRLGYEETDVMMVRRLDESGDDEA